MEEMSAESTSPTFIDATEDELDSVAAKKHLEMEREERENERRKSGGDEYCTSPPSTSSACSFAFCLPNLGVLAPDFRSFLERDLIELSTLRRLENSRFLNWWSTFAAPLWPLSTTGDGNCLLHAASLGMWGVDDRQLVLRNALHDILLHGSRRHALWRRWKWAEWKTNEMAGLKLSEEEWAREWQNILTLASPEPRKAEEESKSCEQLYESLEAIHVFVLAHVLKRPIVVVSDTVLRNACGEELSPVSFGGIYLPLECPPEECHRSPLVLCYDSAHFSPLVCMKDDTNFEQVIPVTDAGRRLLPLHFSVDPGPDFTWWKDEEDERMAKRLETSEEMLLSYMNEYMDIVRIQARRGSTRRIVRLVREAEIEKNDEGVHGKKRILSEITQQVRRTLGLRGGRDKEGMLDVKSCLDGISLMNCIVAAKLNRKSHEYMDELANEYIREAKERFTNSKEDKQKGRTRIGREISAGSIALTCINSHCNQSASQSSNLLCESCLEQQKTMMTSFSCRGSYVMRRVLVKGEEDGDTERQEERESSRLSREERILLDVSSDGHSEGVEVNAVADDNGVTHYYIPQSESAQPSP